VTVNVADSLMTIGGSLLVTGTLHGCGSLFAFGALTFDGSLLVFGALRRSGSLSIGVTFCTY